MNFAKGVKVTPWFLSRNLDFFHFLKYKMDPEKGISEVLERKQALFDYKEHRFKKTLKFAFF